MSTRTVIIFEDIGKEREVLGKAFSKAFVNRTNIHFFDPKAINRRVESYEDQIVDYLKKSKIVIDEIALIITDRDLSKYEKWGGLSESVVSSVANVFAIPLCLYAREDKKYEPKDRIKRITKWSDYKIILDIGKGASKFAEDCKIIFDGFEYIRKQFNVIKKKLPKSPSEMMAQILKKPELQDRIALYGAGDQHMVEDILPYSDKKKNIEKRIPRLLGYWLWDSILRYPGIVVYGEAAASHLNIHPEDFDKPKVKDLFKKALYKGPFAEIREYWWRDELDNILHEASCEDGFAFASKKISKLRECKCSVDKTLKAGYYCMITEKPVSEQNSKSNISWFPAGADLARISKPEYNKLAPWIGFY